MFLFKNVKKHFLKIMKSCHKNQSDSKKELQLAKSGIIGAPKYLNTMMNYKPLKN